ncbi:hypothetical protein [Herbiconiux liangxiaofengii]|uniref:hypothetical protein n=1 Tax=Herbiconiux liangxiaofengii TaxID=3342795 RepID=UPI0035B80467
MRARTAVPALLLTAALVAAGALPAEAYADPRAPQCTVPVGPVQTVVVGELTALTARCTSPKGGALAATALNGTVAMTFGLLLYRATDASWGYDKITVHLASEGPTGPGATVLVRVVEP